jgi:TonB family protein
VPVAQPAAVDSGDSKASVTFMPDVRDYYPAASQALGEEGVVKIRFCYSEAGRVTEATLLESSGFPRLDEAAARVARQYRMRPAVVGGVPQPGCLIAPVKFTASSAAIQVASPTADVGTGFTATPGGIDTFTLTNGSRTDTLTNGSRTASSKPTITFVPDLADYWSPASKQYGEEGMAKVRLCFNEEGKVIGATLVQSSGFTRLDDSALQMASQYRFRPGVADGKPQPACVLLPVKFALSDPQAQSPRYTGQRMSGSFKDVPVRSLLQVISDNSGRAFAVDPAVSGNVTMDINNVPWDQVLDMVMRNRGLERRKQADGSYIVGAAQGAGGSVLR